MIELKNICKDYSNTNVLRNISVKILKQQVTGIIGPNGAGKSTLLKIIAGFEFETSGAVLFDNKELKNFNMKKSLISYMPEQVSLYPDYYVKEYLDFYHSVIKNTNNRLLNSLALNKVYCKKISQLSKGWHQRLKLYSVLANNKPYVVLDEPFDGFDLLQMKEVMRLFKLEKENKKTFILSIHGLSDAEKICDNFVLMDKGQVVLEGSKEMLQEKFNSYPFNLEEIFLKVL
jgi:ABC-2 type transport system ATP-binding protein